MAFLPPRGLHLEQLLDPLEVRQLVGGEKLLLESRVRRLLVQCLQQVQHKPHAGSGQSTHKVVISVSLRSDVL